MPDVRLGSLQDGHLDLTLAEPRLDAPAPLLVVGEGQVWRVPMAARPLVSTEQVSQVLALLPLLLTVGREPAGPVLLDLEALGSLAWGREQQRVHVVLHGRGRADTAPAMSSCFR